MKACVIYKTRTNYKIITESIADIGLLISDDPFFILPITSGIEDIKNAIWNSLNSSRSGISIPKRNDWPLWQKDQLKKMNEKSFPDLYKNSTSCELRIEDRIATIYPYQYINPKNGLEVIEDDIVNFNYSKDTELEITLKIIEILNNPNIKLA